MTQTQISAPEGYSIRPARPEDIASILELIRELAVYEKLEHQLEFDAEGMSRDLFGERPVARALIAEHGGVAVGYAISFSSYSTFKTKRCTFLEDLYVTPDHRGTGLGAALLRAVAASAVVDGSARMQWNVLAWNTPAIEFYERLGATLLADWRVCQVEGDGIAKLARSRR